MRVLASPWTSLAHPPLLAATFVLFLFAQNIEEQVGAAVVLRPLLPDRVFTWFSGQDFYDHYEITDQLLVDQ
jgi:hypothetical protein